MNCSVAAQMCYKLMFANISVATLVAHGALFLRCVVVFSNVCKQKHHIFTCNSKDNRVHRTLKPYKSVIVVKKL